MSSSTVNTTMAYSTSLETIMNLVRGLVAEINVMKMGLPKTRFIALCKAVAERHQNEFPYR